MPKPKAAGLAEGMDIYIRQIWSALVIIMLNINTLGVRKVRGQLEAALQIGSYVRPKTLISVEAKKLLIKNT